MPTTARILKEEIVNTAFEITKESGIEAATTRAIAKKLQCSVQPIFYVLNGCQRKAIAAGKIIVQIW